MAFTTLQIGERAGLESFKAKLLLHLHKFIEISSFLQALSTRFYDDPCAQKYASFENLLNVLREFMTESDKQLYLMDIWRGGWGDGGSISRQ